jgi:hypothetical protein
MNVISPPEASKPQEWQKEKQERHVNNVVGRKKAKSIMPTT